MSGTAGAPDVCLVNMPYAALPRPSMALGLLQALLTEHGIATATAYANLWFAEHAGLRSYQLCAAQVPTDLLIGEWTFRAAAFGADDDRDLAYLANIAEVTRRIPRYQGDGRRLVRDLMHVRTAANEFVDRAAQRVLATGARVVGCTSTFEQHVAALALLRRIRELDPSVITMLGGANCEGAMGEATHDCFPWVDVVVSGEADGLIAPLVRRLLDEGRDLPLADLPRGVLVPASRRRLPVGDGARTLPRALYRDMDSLPCPTFDDYFAEVARTGLDRHVRVGLPVETSRGCWWGAKHQCTFCGLNGSSMSYNSKSPQRVLDDLHRLEDAYDLFDFEVVDNILDMRYFTELLPELERDASTHRLFFEVKANLSRRQVQQLVASGVTWVQPGIESLHTHVLKLMDKGVAGWQNVQLLKWSRELGLRLSWSVLWGFPGEDDDAYRQMAEWIPALEHLQPPASTVRLRYDRFSVYHNEALARGLSLRPVPAMGYIYPVGEKDLVDLAYFFVDGDPAEPGNPFDRTRREIETRPGIRAVTEAASAWRRRFAGEHRPTLTMVDDGEELTVTDTRHCATTPVHRLRGVERAVALACDGGGKESRLAAAAADVLGAPIEPAAVDAAVRRLLDDRLALRIDDRVLGLALPPEQAELPPVTQFPGGSVTLEPLDVESRPTAGRVPANS